MEQERTQPNNGGPPYTDHRSQRCWSSPKGQTMMVHLALNGSQGWWQRPQGKQWWYILHWLDSEGDGEGLKDKQSGHEQLVSLKWPLTGSKFTKQIDMYAEYQKISQVYRAPTTTKVSKGHTTQYQKWLTVNSDAECCSHQKSWFVTRRETKLCTDSSQMMEEAKWWSSHAASPTLRTSPQPGTNWKTVLKAQGSQRLRRKVRVNGAD